MADMATDESMTDKIRREISGAARPITPGTKVQMDVRLALALLTCVAIALGGFAWNRIESNTEQVHVMQLTQARSAVELTHIKEGITDIKLILEEKAKK